MLPTIHLARWLRTNVSVLLEGVLQLVTLGVELVIRAHSVPSFPHARVSAATPDCPPSRPSTLERSTDPPGCHRRGGAGTELRTSPFVLFASTSAPMPSLMPISIPLPSALPTSKPPLEPPSSTSERAWPIQTFPLVLFRAG